MKPTKTNAGIDAGAGLRIRPALAADVPSVIALDEEVTGLAKPNYWRDMFDLYGGRHKERFFLVAERQDRIDGFVIGETSRLGIRFAALRLDIRHPNPSQGPTQRRGNPTLQRDLRLLP